MENTTSPRYSKACPATAPLDGQVDIQNTADYNATRRGMWCDLVRYAERSWRPTLYSEKSECLVPSSQHAFAEVPHDCGKLLPSCPLSRSKYASKYLPAWVTLAKHCLSASQFIPPAFYCDLSGTNGYAEVLDLERLSIPPINE